MVDPNQFKVKFPIFRKIVEDHPPEYDACVLSRQSDSI